MGFPGGASGKEPACNAGDIRDVGLIPGSRRFPWSRAWQPTPVFLAWRMDGGAWQATVHRIAKSQTRLKQLSMHSGLTYKNHFKSAEYLESPYPRNYGL